MPFKSKAQMRKLFAMDPEMARRWMKETPNVKRLPEYKRQRASSPNLPTYRKKHE